MYMQKTLPDIKYLFPLKPDMDWFVSQPATELFSENAVAFLHALSKELIGERKYPEVAAFAFFCRKANILEIKKKYAADTSVRLGRGIVFHITPSNVPVNFAYSLLCGILAGNTNIVRVPSKEFEQVKLIVDAIEKLSHDESYKEFVNRILLIRYDRQSSATAYFSSLCDTRIIWGGDNTIEQVRKNPIPTRSFDITFADRYSLCVINADQYINETELEKIASGFYNDTYLFDQNACTSPHLVVWLGSDENVNRSKEIFWNELHQVVRKKYSTVQPVIAVDKLTTYYTQASQSENISKISTDDNSLWRIELSELPENIDEYRCAAGYFSEYHAGSLTELSSIINRKYQTLVYYGIEKEVLLDFIKNNSLTGIDRMVPVGRASDFSTTWDGFELITTLSRTIEIIS